MQCVLDGGAYAKMLSKLTSLVLTLITAVSANAAIVSNSEITAFGTLYPEGWYGVLGGPEYTIDGSFGTTWRGVNDIQVGQTNFLAYRFSEAYSISSINFYDDYLNSYYMGEMDIQTSDDSLNGLDGTWTTVDHIAGDFAPANGDFSRTVGIDSTLWIRLFMTYQGRAGAGQTPSLLLSEISFNGQPANSPNPVPLPGTLPLLCAGIAALLASRKKIASK
jgi:hypothetical protein